ncbi:MAG TPA: Fic family protein [Solirubrobacterales bacterium]|jgi:Fic family protein|nr:Fic family protein [Solirubrobacterales bacterium]
MLFQLPHLGKPLQSELAQLAELRSALRDELMQPLRWMGSLRREVRASTVASSTSIEGFSVDPGEAAALVSGTVTAETDNQNRQAVACYARAMDHVGAMAADSSFRWLDRVILDLHFDACWFQRDKDPGLWRTGPVGVTAADGSLEFEGPEARQVPGLMREVVGWLQSGDRDADPFARAAMAHLHVTSVHPFRDGNGRVSRIVQSLVLARAGMTSPEFFSIEDHLATHTPAYYAALRETQGGGYHPERDATGWIEFCIDAHLSQARRRLEQIEQAGDRWQRLEGMVAERHWPDRLTIALEQVLQGATDRAAYAAEAEISSGTASADFRRLLDAGLVVQRGRGPGIRYEPSETLRQLIPPARA